MKAAVLNHDASSNIFLPLYPSVLLYHCRRDTIAQQYIIHALIWFTLIHVMKVWSNLAKVKPVGSWCSCTLQCLSSTIGLEDECIWCASTELCTPIQITSMQQSTKLGISGSKTNLYKVNTLFTGRCMFDSFKYDKKLWTRMQCFKQRNCDCVYKIVNKFYILQSWYMFFKWTLDLLNHIIFYSCHFILFFKCAFLESKNKVLLFFQNTQNG